MKFLAILAPALFLAALPVQASEIRLSAAIGNNLVQIIEDEPKAIRVTVNDKTVLEERKSQTIGLVDVYTTKERWFVLLRQTSGDSACPVSYRILDLPAGAPSVSFPFGSCSEDLEVGIADETMTVSMPVKAGTGKAAWTYAEGKLFRSR
jgi:hypothetical protein